MMQQLMRQAEQVREVRQQLREKRQEQETISQQPQQSQRPQRTWWDKAWLLVTSLSIGALIIHLLYPHASTKEIILTALFFQGGLSMREAVRNKIRKTKP